MGKVDCFEIPGLELFFNSSDHRPPHIHVRKPDEYEIRVFLRTTTEKKLDMQVKWARVLRVPAAGVRQELLRKVPAHRERLLGQWERKVCPR